jgi:hypothetical protein
MAVNEAREQREVAGAPRGERLEGVAVRGGDIPRTPALIQSADAPQVRRKLSLF